MPLILSYDIEKIRNWLERIYTVTNRAREAEKFSEKDFKDIENAIKEIEKMLNAIRF